MDVMLKNHRQSQNNWERANTEDAYSTPAPRLGTDQDQGPELAAYGFQVTSFHDELQELHWIELEKLN